MTAVDLVHLGDPRHGVTRYGHLLDRALAAHTSVTVRRHELAGGDRAGETVERLVIDRPPTVIHLQFSDWLLGPDHDGGVARLAAALERARACGHRIVLTMHDLPGLQPDDDPDLVARRLDRYRMAVDAAHRIVVCGGNEAAAIRRCGTTTGTNTDTVVSVIPHLVEERPGGRAPMEPQPPGGHVPVVTVLGYLYPGKGHDRAIEAVAALSTAVRLRFAGGSAAGHEDLRHHLTDLAEALDVSLTIDGWIDEADLPAVLAETTVPLAPQAHPSASGSIATWQSVGRRPVVGPNGYTRWLASQAPGCVDLAAGADTAALSAAIEAALADPARTHLAAVPAPFRPQAVAGQYATVYRSEARLRGGPPTHPDQEKPWPSSSPTAARS